MHDFREFAELPFNFDFDIRGKVARRLLNLTLNLLHRNFINSPMMNEILIMKGQQNLKCLAASLLSAETLYCHELSFMAF